MLDLRTFAQAYGSNGIGLHYFDKPYNSDPDLWAGRMAAMGVTSTTTLCTNVEVLRAFKRHGISVVCRPFRRAYQPFTNDGSPVQSMQAAGLLPVVQLNNEDELSEEWDGQEVNWYISANHLLNASEQVYDEGGYVGWQMLDFDYLKFCLDEARARHAERIFDRLVFIPHPYGLNHPPEYSQDESSFLGFNWFAAVFQAELGFIPPMIAGEMGWCIGSEEDNRYPKVTPELHAQYAKTVFEGFKKGTHPDYLIACNWWLLGSSITLGDGRFEAASIYKADGSRLEQFVQALTDLGPFTRKFSWDTEQPEEEPMPELELVEAFARYHEANPDQDVGTPISGAVYLNAEANIICQTTNKGVFWYQYGTTLFLPAASPK